MPDEVERHLHLFVVRAWREPGRTPAEDQWRSSVDVVPTGERRYFAAHEDLADYLLAQLAEAGWGQRPQAAEPEPLAAEQKA
jgi:hypothetical protein